MTEPTLSASKTGTAAPRAGSLLRQAVMGRLRLLRQGWLQVREGESVMVFGDRLSPLRAVIEVRDEAVWGMVACNGSIGAGEAYIQGYWSSPDLAAVTRLFVANLDALDALEGGLARLGRPALKLLH